jgi:triosephosphate isomerase
LKDVGVEGIMINHSEHRMRLDDIEFIISKSKLLGLKTLACGATPASVAAIASMNPYMVAVEPPELIGTGIPVSKAKPEVILNTVDRVRKVNKDVIILTGAGISPGDDARKAVELGTQGVLVASAVMKSSDPKRKMLELANALAT